MTVFRLYPRPDGRFLLASYRAGRAPAYVLLANLGHLRCVDIRRVFRAALCLGD